MSENSSEVNLDMSAHEDDINSENEGCIRTQEEISKHIRKCFVPLTEQLIDLTRFFQGMSCSQQPNI